MKKILSVGGAGFIGTNFYKLFGGQYDIAIFDDGTYASTITNGLWDLGIPRLYEENVTDLKALKDVIETEKPDCVINFASETHVDRSIHEAGSFLPTNAIGAENVARAVLDAGIRLVHISTDEVYGDTDIESFDEFRETDKLNPSSPYSAAKAAADHMIGAYVRTYGLNASIVRPTNNYGPYQYPEKLIPFFIKRMLQGRTLPIYGTGQNLREWLYVEDCCKGIELVMNEGKPGEVYNIGSGVRETSVYIGGELTKTNERFEFITDRPGHDRRYAVDSTKIKELGWEPEMDIREGLILTKKFYEERYELIKNLEANSHIK